MNEESVERELAAQYSAALRDYSAGVEGHPLLRAYRLGRRAIAENFGLPALEAAHHAALKDLAARAIETEEGVDVELQAEEFFREALAPFERSSRGGDVITRMRLLNESLERTNRRLIELKQKQDRTIAELRQTAETSRQGFLELEKRVQAQTSALATTGATLRGEIAERKLTEIALRESEARFRAVFERAGIGIALLDENGRIRECNSAFQDMLGFDAEELHNRVIFELSYPEDFEISVQRFKGLVEGRYRHYRLEKRFVRKDRTVVWVRKIVSGTYGFSGELQFAVDMIEDITESRTAEESLRESEARFRQIVDMASEWIWEQDAKGCYTYSSAAVHHILGYRAEEIVGKPYYELFFPEDLESSGTPAQEPAGRQESFVRLINRYRHKNGREVFTESTGIPVFDRRGRLLKWRGVDHNVTERKRFEDALRLRDRAIEASSVGIIITDPYRPGNPIIYANPAFVQMTGRSRDEVIGWNPRFLQGPETDPQAIEEIRKAMREQRDCHLTLKNYRKDGTPFWNELFISPVRDDHGRLTHFIGTQTDVTAMRRIEEERHEMEIARQIQLSLLPSVPLRMKGALVAGYCLPAVHVGGDYFDYFATEEGVDIVIADVSGHSVGAALIMAETRSTLKMGTDWMAKGAAKLRNGARKTLSVLNDLLFEDLNRASFFISMFYLSYHSGTRRIRYANAGHNRPLLLRRGERSCLELDAEGLILGVKKGVTFEEKALSLNEGDMVLLYTDGITEAQNRQGEFFGESRLCELVVGHAQSSPEELIRIIVDELGAFRQGRSFDDDISLVVLKAL
ncbi:signal transduction protein [Methylocaldum marinum]|uniref:Signal transduction protein n=1 Tax=Methylocaldum marinum TaxID=1432792 RepID=A0A250KUR4_9GAMM|nr:PAS domain S-box protein [Methylocaldum marinum]BBA35357.1 signal transduction protein [Methylocaldum marinum]